MKNRAAIYGLAIFLKEQDRLQSAGIQKATDLIGMTVLSDQGIRSDMFRSVPSKISRYWRNFQDLRGNTARQNFATKLKELPQRAQKLLKSYFFFLCALCVLCGELRFFVKKKKLGVPITEGEHDLLSVYPG